MPPVPTYLDLVVKMTRDGWLLLAARAVRMFAYGLLSVVLLFYLRALGFETWQSTLLVSLTLAGDMVMSLWITTIADTSGRRRMLLVSAALMVLSGLLMAVTGNFVVLLIGATLGVLSPSAQEVGPFQSIEQAALAQIVSSRRRTDVFAWYNLIGAVAAALGTSCGGRVADWLRLEGAVGPEIYRPLMWAYAGFGLLIGLLFLALSPRAEIHIVEDPEAEPADGSAADDYAPLPSADQPPDAERPASLFDRIGLPSSGQTVFHLAGLFAIDAFAGGFILQAFTAQWLADRFAVDLKTVGDILAMANLLGGLSALAAAGLAHRIGLLNTMVVTHLPSNVLLILTPLMPDLPLTILVIMARYSISQMDIPTRQAYTMAVVPPEERSAAAGVTNVTRSMSSSASSLLAGYLYAAPHLASIPFLLAGGLKIIYDVLLYRSFADVKLPKETPGEDTLRSN